MPSGPSPFSNEGDCHPAHERRLFRHRRVGRGAEDDLRDQAAHTVEAERDARRPDPASRASHPRSEGVGRRQHLDRRLRPAARRDRTGAHGSPHPAQDGAGSACGIHQRRHRADAAQRGPLPRGDHPAQPRGAAPAVRLVREPLAIRHEVPRGRHRARVDRDRRHRHRPRPSPLSPVSGLIDPARLRDLRGRSLRRLLRAHCRRTEAPLRHRTAAATARPHPRPGRRPP